MVFAIIQVFSWLLRLFRFSVDFWDCSGFKLAWCNFSGFSVGVIRASSWLLGFFSDFQLAYGLVRVFSYLVRFSGFSVGVWVCSGFQLAFGIVRVFS